MHLQAQEHGPHGFCLRFKAAVSQRMMRRRVAETQAYQLTDKAVMKLPPFQLAAPGRASTAADSAAAAAAAAASSPFASLGGTAFNSAAVGPLASGHSAASTNGWVCVTLCYILCYISGRQ